MFEYGPNWYSFWATAGDSAAILIAMGFIVGVPLSVYMARLLEGKWNKWVWFTAAQYALALGVGLFFVWFVIVPLLLWVSGI